MDSFSILRVNTLNAAPVRHHGAYVLYWMVASRRLEWNFALDRAAWHARALGLPLVILEAIRADYPWASPRHHAFCLDGMREHGERLAGSGVAYLPYVEPTTGAGKGLMEALAAQAAVVVTDDDPAFFLRRMQTSAAPRTTSAASCGRRSPGTFWSCRHPTPSTASPRATCRRRCVTDGPLPRRHSWAGRGARWRRSRWTGPSRRCRCGGGREAAIAALDRFLADGLARYGEERNHPDSGAASGLSPWLHWGHLSVHEVFRKVAERASWSPAWALDTLANHAGDERPWVYAHDDFDQARTHDPLWNAAQRELRETGVMHNYLRMLWGKTILEWSAGPEEALSTMIELNNRYALDGRDLNSYTGIFWVLGRFDRGWPERPIYGKVRSMSSASTRRKLRLDAYLERWGGQGTLELAEEGR